jgi:hypothetical protein
MSLDVCIPDMPEVTPEADFRENPAQWTYQRLIKQINTFECGLTDEEEIGARLVATPAGVFHIEQIGYWAPDILIFIGKNAHGKPTQLLQHYTQLSLELTALPKEKEIPRRRIGFIFEKKLPSSPIANNPGSRA